jgi:hypothetical protein
MVEIKSFILIFISNSYNDSIYDEMLIINLTL